MSAGASDDSLEASVEERALAFARDNHRELAELLGQLKTGNGVEYERAIRDLAQTSERIQRVRERSPQRHSFVLALWKLDSRIRLMSARMVMSDNPAMAEELKSLVQQKTELRLQELKAERDQAQARLRKLEAEIAAMESDPEAAARKELLQVQRQLDEQTRAFRKGKAAGAKNSSGPNKSDREQEPASSTGKAGLSTGKAGPDGQSVTTPSNRSKAVDSAKSPPQNSRATTKNDSVSPASEKRSTDRKGTTP